MRAFQAILSLALPFAAVACTGGANPSSGQTAYMQLEGAQYVPGELDTTTKASSPEMGPLSFANNDLYPGVTGKTLGGTLGPGSTGALIGLAGDSGYWIVPVPNLDETNPGDFAFSTHVSFSSLTPIGAGTVIARAVDKQGNIGPANLTTVIMKAARPDGALVISLDWDTEADLDLHVVLPSDVDAGVNEIWSRKPSGLAPGTPNATDDDGMTAGYLDFDSNSMCVIDGRRVENVIFPTTAPTGHYIVRVDTFSLCGEATARYRVQVFTQGSAAPSLTAYGQSTDTDTRFTHGQGAGVQVLSFDYAQ